MNNNVHLMDFYNKIHFKVDIFKIIPNEIIICHRKHFKPLIMGYIRQNENDLPLQSIPFPLQMLILTYFPLF